MATFMGTERGLPRTLVFNNKPGTNLTNVMHRYPAMLHTEMVDFLFERLQIRGGLLLDPFCGTGRSLLSAVTHGCSAIGVDVNPMACLIARAKLTPMDTSRLERMYRAIITSKTRKSAVPIEDHRLRFWFSDQALHDVGVLLQRLIDHLPSFGPSKAFFYTALSETIRDVSYTRRSEYKLYRMSDAQRRQHKPNVLTLFDSKVRRNLTALSKANPILKGSPGRARIYCCDWLKLSRESVLPAEGVDYVITSPPYGDSRTTVAYGEFSKLSLWILSYDPVFAESYGLSSDVVSSLDARCLGGYRSPAVKAPLPTIAVDLIASIEGIDRARASVMERFLRGYLASLNEAAQVLKPQGLMVLVLGNRNVAGQCVPLDKITRAAAAQMELRHVCSSRREVPYKRLPRLVVSSSRAIPTATMTREYVLVLRKM